MAGEIGPLGAACKLIDQGKHEQALSRLGEVGPADPEYGDAAVWSARARFEWGRIHEAAEQLRLALQRPLPEPAATRCRLWLGFVHLYGVAPPDAADPSGAFLAVAAEAVASPDALTRALAADLRGRVAALRVALGWDPPAARPDAVGLMELAIEKYRGAGEHREAIRARLRLAHACRPRPHGDPDRSLREFARAAEEASAAGYLVTQADARLAVTEADWDRVLAAHEPGADFRLMQARFEQVAALYRDAGHAFGGARVDWACASVLLKYGHPEGVEIARAAADSLAAAGEATVQQDVWKTLHLWHTLHGSPGPAREARDRSEGLSRGMAFPLAAGVDQLAAADTALRDGRYGEAERRLHAVVRDPALRDVHIPARLVLSNVYARANRAAEAVAAVSAVIDELERAGGSPFLVDARLGRANLLFEAAPADADADFERVLAIDRECGDSVAESHHRVTRAWARVNSARRSGRLSAAMPEVEDEFRAAEAALLPLRTLDARRQLGNLHQHWGQAAFVAEDWGECGRRLTAAEDVFRGHDLRPDLAFTLVHQGLVMVHLGRARGPELYDAARGRFSEAEGLFRESGVGGMLWKPPFHLGICDREQGSDWDHPGSDAQRSRWESADALFLRASGVIDTHRNSLAGETDSDNQNASVSFAGDKQEVYREGFQLAALLRQDTASAVQWLERMKGRAMLDALASAAPPAPVDRPQHPLVARDVRLRGEMRTAATHPEVAVIRQGIDANLEEMAGDPATAGYAALRRSDPPSWAHVREALKAEEARRPGRRIVVGQFYHGAPRPLLFGMRADWDAPRMARLEVNFSRLNQFIDFCFRDGEGGLRMMRERLDREWSAFAPLIAPLADWAGPGDAVVLVPHNALHSLPLHTLPLGGTILGERNVVTYAPSLSVLYHILNRPPNRPSPTGAPGRTAVFGDPTGDRPHVRAAAVAAAGADGSSRGAVLGPDVTRDCLLAGLAESDRFLYAGHGTFEAADGMRSGLRLANNVSLTAANVFGLARTPPLVVLGGCVTGVHERRAGDELLGLVRALLLKGTRAVIASQWKVPDEATGALVRAFAQGIAGGSGAADALQTALRTVRTRSGWGHPYHWGGFVTYGWD